MSCTRPLLIFTSTQHFKFRPYKIIQGVESGPAVRPPALSMSQTKLTIFLARGEIGNRSAFKGPKMRKNVN